MHERFRDVALPQQRDERLQHPRHGQRGGPLLGEHPEPHLSRGVDVAVEDPRVEDDRRRLEGVVQRDVEVEEERAAVVGRALGAVENGGPFVEVVALGPRVELLRLALAHLRHFALDPATTPKE
eukprot:CAMPEP_0174900622 /NCGR_PEP_ID=MMETSP0167-20121228/32003_1 /TAXON_ID=38298 /ORGANISM="Rhodella maculata, Strain CCMP736" /LENGTH=123 /DNA_ID=CAMNT_0016142071 /DNA_START=177 /DNA_END=548 /DNA_ORIENTATION=+